MNNIGETFNKGQSLKINNKMSGRFSHFIFFFKEDGLLEFVGEPIPDEETVPGSITTLWKISDGVNKQTDELKLQDNGNLELLSKSGQILWQSDTKNQGIIAFKLVNKGIELVDATGKSIWSKTN